MKIITKCELNKYQKYVQVSMIFCIIKEIIFYEYKIGQK